MRYLSALVSLGLSPLAARAEFPVGTDRANTIVSLNPPLQSADGHLKCYAHIANHPNGKSDLAPRIWRVTCLSHHTNNMPL